MVSDLRLRVVKAIPSKATIKLSSTIEVHRPSEPGSSEGVEGGFLGEERDEVYGHRVSVLQRET